MTSPTPCLCQQGYYSDGGTGAASDGRQLGLRCAPGSDLANSRKAQQSISLGRPRDSRLLGPFPTLKENDWTSVQEPTSVFRCSDGDACPGGDPGTCAYKLASIA